MALYNCQTNAAANTSDNTNCGCEAAASETERSCGCTGENCCGAATVGSDLLILAAIVLLLIALLR